MAPGTAESSGPTQGRAGDRAQIEALADRLVEEMAACWREGRCATAEEFLARHPALAAHPEAAVRLIYEEVCLRQEAGQAVRTVEVVRRFPRWQAELQVLF